MFDGPPHIILFGEKWLVRSNFGLLVVFMNTFFDFVNYSAAPLYRGVQNNAFYDVCVVVQ